MKSQNEDFKLTKKRRRKFIRNIGITLVSLLLILGILKVAPKYKKPENTDKVNLIINNNNVTGSLKKDIFIQDNIIYVSKLDIQNFFDQYIYYDNTANRIITTYESKTASIVIGEKIMRVNGIDKDISGTIIEKDEIYYLPFSEMEEVYNIDITYIKEKQGTVVADSLDREQIKADTNRKMSVKRYAESLCRTVDKVEKAEDVVVIKVFDDWTKIRTARGKIGYVKTDSLTNKIQVRQKLEQSPIIEGKVNLVWDYYSEYVEAPNRMGTTIQGVNVVSPSFFSLVKQGNGEIDDNVGESGKNYVKWAKDNGYQVWAMFSNNSMMETTSTIVNNYTLREKMIENIINLAIKYDLDGINVDFENMYKEDKSLFSRFLIELQPRLREYGICLSVDVTAPDGSDTWSLCFDRYVIGDVADYIIFMAYDQYTQSSPKPGTTAGYNWVEVNVKKFLGQEGVKPEKLILGLPFYTRIWTVNGEAFTSSTVDMNKINNVLPSDAQRNWLDDVKQYYTEYTAGNSIKKMWIEDEESIKAKVGLVNQYKLAGVASWEKDRETSNIWTIIEEGLK